MDNQKLTEVRQSRGAVGTLVVSIVFSVLSTLAVCFYASFIFAVIEGKLASLDGADLGDGLQMAFGLVFAIIAGAASALLSVIGLSTSIVSLKLADGKVKSAGKVFLILNAVILSLVVIGIIAAMIIVGIE